MPNHFSHIKYLLFGFLTILLWNSCTTNTERLDDFEVHGIDVSHYQKVIDWNTVAQQNIEFAFVKASEGQTYRDSLFCGNWD